VVSLPLGGQEQLTATASFSDGTSTDVTSQATWLSSDTSVASVFASSDGLQWTGASAQGSATISAAWSGLSGSAAVSVTPAALTSLQLSPGAASIAKGTAQQFAAVGLYSDGTRQDLTAQATWTVSDGTVASPAAGGLVSGAAAGSATVTATVGAIAASSALAVTSAALTSIEVGPDSPSIALGTTQQLSATGIFSDATTQDLTAQVAWTSSSSAASISAGGLAASASVGSATISASLLGVTGSTLLTVTSATLVAVDISQSAVAFAVKTSCALTAAAVFSDGSVQDVSSQASWTSSDATVATVSAGVATGVAAGSATLAVSFGGFSASAAITVTSATLVSIAVSPAAASVPTGVLRQLSASGTFSDGSAQDLTAQVVWSSSNNAVATVSNAPGSQGLAQSLSAGAANIFARLLGVSGSTSLTVTSAHLVAIAIGPQNPMLPVKFWSRLSATGSYSDGSSVDLTSQAVWTSSSTAVATVSNASGAQGVDSGAGAGTSTITAQLGSLQGSAVLTVFSAKLDSIAIVPSTVSLAVGQWQRVSAVGSWANGFSMDVTLQVRWSSSQHKVVTASNGARGLLVGMSAGSATVSATRSGKSGTASVSVQ